MKPISNQDGTVQTMYRFKEIYAKEFENVSFDIYKTIRETNTPMGKPISKKVIFKCAVTQELLNEMSQLNYGYVCPVCEDQGVNRISGKSVFCRCELGLIAKNKFDRLEF